MLHNGYTIHRVTITYLGFLSLSWCFLVLGKRGNYKCYRYLVTGTEYIWPNNLSILSCKFSKQHMRFCSKLKMKIFKIITEIIFLYNEIFSASVLFPSSGIKTKFYWISIQINQLSIGNQNKKGIWINKNNPACIIAYLYSKLRLPEITKKSTL